MKLYRVEASTHGWDQFDSFIVCAPDAEKAKQLAIAESEYPLQRSNFDNDSTVVTELTPPDTAEVVLGSFNAG